MALFLEIVKLFIRAINFWINHKTKHKTGKIMFEYEFLMSPWIEIYRILKLKCFSLRMSENVREDEEFEFINLTFSRSNPANRLRKHIESLTKPCFENIDNFNQTASPHKKTLRHKYNLSANPLSRKSSSISRRFLFKLRCFVEFFSQDV